MSGKAVAIVVAMARELAPMLRGVRPQEVDGLQFFELDRVVVAVGGIGRKAATRAAQAAVEGYEPSMMVSAGIAGALSPGLKVGDVVAAREVVDTTSGIHFASSGGDAVVATVSSVSGPAEKRMLAERWNADVVDMEAAAVAEVARSRGIEFAAVKTISDSLDFVMPPVGKFANDAGKFDTLKFVAYLAVRPKWWQAVRHLDHNSRIAAVNLSHALQHRIPQWLLTAPHQGVSGS